MKFENLILYAVDLRLFDGELNLNKTTDTTASTGNDLSAEMKTFYSDYLIEMAEAKLVHSQFGQKKPIPKGNGKTVEFRRYDPLPKITTPLGEGVTPDGQKLTVIPLSVDVKQYGGYVALTDVLLLTAIDNNLAQATKLLGSQAGRTLDTITREVLNGGTNVQFWNGTVSGGRSAISKDHKLNVDCIRRAARNLKVMNAEPIDDAFVAIIHPDCAYDLMSDPDWKYPHQYKDTENLYNGEIGKVAGVRFVETTEAKVFADAGASGIDVYSTIVLGDNAYGVVDIQGGGLEHIVKQLGSAGTADPLNQRATAGWKATHAAVRLVEPYMIRIETASTFDAGAN
jgi:N4-gp56 family major capsid protein